VIVFVAHTAHMFCEMRQGAVRAFHTAPLPLIRGCPTSLVSSPRNLLAFARQGAQAP